MGSSFTNHPSDILSAWIAQEVLSPQIFRQEKDLAGIHGSVIPITNGPLPWETGQEIPKPGYRPFYQIVLSEPSILKIDGGPVENTGKQNTTVCNPTTTRHTCTTTRHTCTTSCHTCTTARRPHETSDHRSSCRRR